MRKSQILYRSGKMNCYQSYGAFQHHIDRLWDSKDLTKKKSK